MRRLTAAEIEELLGRDLPARLATIDADGPHVTARWFCWNGAVIRMTSRRGAPHLRRLEADPRACVLVDDERSERPDGERPNRQVRLVGTARLTPDEAGAWTERITRRYLVGPAADEAARRRASHQRVVIELRPRTVVAVASV